MSTFKHQCARCGDEVVLDKSRVGKRIICDSCRFRFAGIDLAVLDEARDRLDEIANILINGFKCAMTEFSKSGYAGAVMRTWVIIAAVAGTSYLMYSFLFRSVLPPPSSPFLLWEFKDQDKPELGYIVAHDLPKDSKVFFEPESFFWFSDSKGMKLVADKYINLGNRIVLKPRIPLISGEVYVATLDLSSEGKFKKIVESGKVPQGPIPPPPPSEAKVGRIDFVRCPPNSSSSQNAQLGSKNEEPGRESDGSEDLKTVLIKSFWIGKRELTRSEYFSTMDESVYVPANESSLPIANITWSQANDFCAKFSRRYGVKARLPTEDEWEFAARAGSDLPFSVWKRGFNHLKEDLENRDVKNDDGFNRDTLLSFNYNNANSKNVGAFPANPWGLHDMHGNVWEWCVKMPLQDNFGKTVARGGGWASAEWWKCRSSSRDDSYGPEDKNESIGMRVLMEID
jgi:hypothetical protein